jgi:AAHS family 3-hydroxyphenylpropionic acid transporter
MLTTASEHDARLARLTLALCCLVAVLEGFDLQAAGVAAPTLAPALALSSSNLGWFFSSSTFGLILGAVAGGRLSDLWGRKVTLLVSVGTFGVMSVATGLSPTVSWLLLARFLTGLGIGGAVPNVVALTSENAPPNRRTAFLGVLYAGLPGGGALASLVAAMGGAHNWKVIFLTGGVAPLISLPLLILWLPDSRQLHRVASVQGQIPRPRGFLFALFAEGRAARSVLLGTGFFLSLLTMYIVLSWLPTLLVAKGLSRLNASWAQVSFNLLGAIASVLTGRLMARIALPAMVSGAFVLSAACLLLLAFIPATFGNSMLAAGLVGIGLSATQALIYAVASVTYPTEVRGTGIGTAVCAGRVGSAVGPLLAAFLLHQSVSPEGVLAILAPMILLAGAAIFALSKLDTYTWA